jgi:hypothetical protein
MFLERRGETLTVKELRDGESNNPIVASSPALLARPSLDVAWNLKGLQTAWVHKEAMAGRWSGESPASDSCSLAGSTPSSPAPLPPFYHNPSAQGD